jgi:hypothetical protein
MAQAQSFFDENGELHNDNGPAITYENGTKVWYQHGKMHRIGGPALEYSDGTGWWYINGMRHRIDGPAWTDANGKQEWYFEDRWHRIDGPAVITPLNGQQNQIRTYEYEWYINGRNVTKQAKEFYEEHNLDPTVPLSKDMSMLFKLTFA